MITGGSKGIFDQLGFFAARKVASSTKSVDFTDLGLVQLSTLADFIATKDMTSTDSLPWMGWSGRSQFPAGFQG